MRERDISYRSMTILESRFADIVTEDVWVPDWGEIYSFSSARHSNVLLMGLFFHRIFQLDYWPEGEFKLFCLSSSVKKILTRLFNFDEDVISIVQRYDFFPKAKVEKEFPQGSNFCLIHAGRISPQKNIEFLIFMTFYFQLLLSSKIQLKLMGNFDNEYHHDVLGIQIGSYKEKINHLIGSLPWPGRAPEIITEFGTEQWCDHIPEDGIIVSASNLISEDFSVSMAQSQEKGIPCMVPFWGGFIDVLGSNIKHYDVNMIAGSYADLRSISNAAQAFVKKYIDGNLFLKNFSSNPAVNLDNSKKINKDYLRIKIDENKRKWGQELSYIENKNFPHFAKSQVGQNFFKEYRKIFSGVAN